MKDYQTQQRKKDLKLGYQGPMARRYAECHAKIAHRLTQPLDLIEPRSGSERRAYTRPFSYGRRKTDKPIKYNKNHRKPD